MEQELVTCDEMLGIRKIEEDELFEKKASIAISNYYITGSRS